LKITSFEKLQQYLLDDERQQDTRIVRFINVETLELWCKVKNLLASKCANNIQLSDYCSDQDLTPNLNRLLKSLRDIKTDTLLVPLSEHLRINRNENILSQIVNLEYTNLTNNYVRLFVLFYRMSSPLVKLINLDSRLVNSVIFLETNIRDDNYSLIILPQDLPMKIKGNNIKGYKNYLLYWESNPNMPIILHTNNAIYYRDYAFTDNVKVIDSAYDILLHLDTIDKKIEKSYGNDWAWPQLLSKVEYGISIYDIFSRSLSVKDFDAKALISIWNNQDNFGRWLIWLWIKLEAKTPYLRHTMYYCNDFREFISSLSNAIFSISPADKQYKILYDERKEYLQLLDISDLPLSYWNKYAESDITERLYRLTDLTQHEREEIIVNSTIILDDDKSREFLKISYQLLYDYLIDYIFEDTRVTEYFSKYKKQKLQNSFDEDFLDEVKKIASRKGIWWELGIKSRTDLVNEHITNNTKIIWIDALGAEFLGLVQTILGEIYPGYYSKVSVGYSTLPTITENNKDFTIDRQVDYIKELDNLVHNGQYPGYITGQIDIIYNQIKAAILKLDMYERIILTSDHGATRGAVIAKGDNLKTLENSSVERGGRYCVDSTNKYEPKYSNCIDVNEYHILTGYDRFSIQGSAKNETHGGATLEEVLVPVLILSRVPLEETISIILLTPEPRVKLGKAIVKFKVNKNFDKLNALINNRKYSCTKQDDFWYFEVECDQRVEYSAKIFTNTNIGSFDFKVNKGITENKDFDI
jgi:hypothetical protein